MTDVKTKTAFLDTNILFRAINSEAGQHVEINAFLDRLRAEDYQFWISRQIIREYLGLVTRQGFGGLSIPLSSEVAIHHVKSFRRNFRIANETAIVTHHLLELIRQFPTGGKQIHDANIVATMLAYNIETLLTLNVSDMRRFQSKITLLTI